MPVITCASLSVMLSCQFQLPPPKWAIAFPLCAPRDTIDSAVSLKMPMSPSVVISPFMLVASGHTHQFWIFSAGGRSAKSHDMGGDGLVGVESGVGVFNFLGVAWPFPIAHSSFVYFALNSLSSAVIGHHHWLILTCWLLTIITSTVSISILTTLLYSYCYLITATN